MSTFNSAFEAWQAAADFRACRHRYKRYTYGRQWDDPTDDENYPGMTERQVAMVNGQTPHTNNLIRQLVKCVIGNFRSSIASADPAADSSPDSVTAERNALTELDCRSLEEFLISGCAIQRIVCEKRPAGSGVWIDNVGPDDFFVNRFKDPRGLDIELIGMLHSMPMREVVMRYGSSAANKERIVRAYGHTTGSASADVIGRPSTSRFFNAGPGRCRVIEVWTLESRNYVRCHDVHEGRSFISRSNSMDEIECLNKRRRQAGIAPVRTLPFPSLRWHCRIFTPTGDLLDSYDSPYAHGMHPFAVKQYPLIDGEIHSLVEDIIDQQRHINSLITLIDQIMRVSAKGVLLFPVDQRPEGMSWKEIANAWTRPSGIIPYEAGHSSRMPQQIVSGGEDAGAYRMLETQLSLFQKVSGVSEALQGQLPQSQTSAALYDAQLRTSAVALLDLLDSFNDFRRRRNVVIAQCEKSYD